MGIILAEDCEALTECRPHVDLDFVSVTGRRVPRKAPEYVMIDVSRLGWGGNFRGSILVVFRPDVIVDRSQGACGRSGLPCIKRKVRLGADTTDAETRTINGPKVTRIRM